MSTVGNVHFCKLFRSSFLILCYNTVLIVWLGLGTNNSGFVSTNKARKKKKWFYIKNIGFTVSYP